MKTPMHSRTTWLHPRPRRLDARSATTSAVAALVASLTTGGGCLFLPAIDDDGYLACERDADCGAGRACVTSVNLCAPPPWNDTGFSERRLLVVENPGGSVVPKGAAVPVNVGGDNAVLALDDVAADARFTDFSFGDNSWRVVGVFRDLFADRFTVWVPVPADIPAGGRGVLAWLEQATVAGTPTVLEDPAAAFALFDDLDAFPADEDGGEQYLISAPGAATPGIAEGAVTIPDNVTVIWRQELLPPVDLTFRARVNGLTCDEVFVGLTGNDAVGFNPPSAGFFIAADLLTIAEVAPTSTSNPEGLSDPTLFNEQPNAQHRFRVQVDGETVRFLIDDVVFDERTDLRPAFDPAAPLFATVQVGGACSIEIDAVWATPLPSVARPTVSVEAPVLLNITF